MSVFVSSRGNAQFRTERREYRLLFALSLPLFVAATMASRLFPSATRSSTLARGSAFAIFRDARAAAHSILPHAFMR